MKVEDRIDTARSRSGLGDFEEDSFREGLERLVNSISASALKDSRGSLSAQRN